MKVKLRFLNATGNYLIGATIAAYGINNKLLSGKITRNANNWNQSLDGVKLATSNIPTYPSSYAGTTDKWTDVEIEYETDFISYIAIPYFSPYVNSIDISLYKNGSYEFITNLYVPADSVKTKNKEWCKTKLLNLGRRTLEELGFNGYTIDKEMVDYKIQDFSLNNEQSLFDGVTDGTSICDWTTDSDYITINTKRYCNIWIHQPAGLSNSNIGIDVKSYRYIYNEYNEELKDNIPHHDNWRMLVKVLSPGTYRLIKDNSIADYNPIDEIYFETANTADLIFPESENWRLNSNIYKNLFPELTLDMDIIWEKMQITPSSFNEILQPDHGFQVNDILYKISDNKYRKAIADGTNKSKVAGMVTKVDSKDKFTIMDVGIYPYMHLPYKDTSILYLSDKKAGALGHYLDMYDKIYIPVAIYADDKIILNIQGGISGTLLQPYSENDITMEFETYQQEDLDDIIKTVLRDA